MKFTTYINIDRICASTFLPRDYIPCCPFTDEFMAALTAAGIPFAVQRLANNTGNVFPFQRNVGTERRFFCHFSNSRNLTIEQFRHIETFLSAMEIEEVAALWREKGENIGELMKAALLVEDQKKLEQSAPTSNANAAHAGRSQPSRVPFANPWVAVLNAQSRSAASADTLKQNDCIKPGATAF